MKTSDRITYLIMISLLVGVMWLNTASALPLDLNSPELQHGTVLTDQFASQGVHVSAVNRGGGPNKAIIFDSDRTGWTRDPDLQWDQYNWEGGAGDGWESGNIDRYDHLGNLIIIAENNWGCDDGVCDKPDDEGSRPAGSIYFDFEYDISEFGFDLIDVEGPDEYGDDSGFFAAFYNGDNLVKSIGFAELIARDNATFGNNSANRIAPISAEELGLSGFSGFDRVEINMGGSGGVANINFVPVVPEPGTILLLGLGLAALAGLKRKFRK